MRISEHSLPELGDIRHSVAQLVVFSTCNTWGTHRDGTFIDRIGEVRPMLYVDPYVRDTFRKNQPEGRNGYIRLDQNENPDGLPRWFFDEVMKEITPSFLAMYPEEGSLVKKYAAMVGVGPENVTLTDGSLLGMGYLTHVFGEPGKNMVVVKPTFNMYGVFASLNGMGVVEVPYEADFSMPIEKILAAIDDRTGIVVLVNPNMPVGNVYAPEDIEKVVKKAGEFGALVIVDEAYHYFYDGSSIALVSRYDNVAVLRTFSKMLAITSLRLGVIVSSKEIIHYVNNWRPHYTIGGVTLKFGEAIVDNHERLLKELEENFREGKEYILKRLEEKGYSAIPSNGCFLCVRLKHRPVQYVADEMKKRNILIFCGSGPLDGYVRLSVCGKKYMRMFADSLFEIDRE